MIAFFSEFGTLLHFFIYFCIEMNIIWRFIYVCAFLLLSMLGYAEEGFDKLIQQFDQTEDVVYANKLFVLYNKEKLTDSLLQFDDKTPKDTLRAETWYWTAEYLLAKQRYKEAAFYGEKAYPLFKDILCRIGQTSVDVS